MTSSIWCDFIIASKILNKCKWAYLYVTTASNRIQNYLDPDCSSRAWVAMDMKLFPDSDEIENRILLPLQFVCANWNTKNNPILAQTRFKEGLKLEILEIFSWNLVMLYLNVFSANRIIYDLTLFDSNKTRIFWKLVAISH